MCPLLHELDSEEENFTRYVIVVIPRTNDLTTTYQRSGNPYLSTVHAEPQSTAG
jgi:hypothetical protein